VSQEGFVVHQLSNLACRHSYRAAAARLLHAPTHGIDSDPYWSSVIKEHGVKLTDDAMTVLPHSEQVRRGRVLLRLLSPQISIVTRSADDVAPASSFDVVLGYKTFYDGFVCFQYDSRDGTVRTPHVGAASSLILPGGLQSCASRLFTEVGLSVVSGSWPNQRAGLL